MNVELISSARSHVEASRAIQWRGKAIHVIALKQQSELVIS